MFMQTTFLGVEDNSRGIGYGLSEIRANFPFLCAYCYSKFYSRYITSIRFNCMPENRWNVV